MDCNENQTDNDPNKPKSDPKPPLIYIYGVSDYSSMIQNLTLATEKETFYTKTLGNNTVQINPKNPESYRKLINHVRAEKIIYHSYQLKQERAYGVVIKNLHHSISLEEIKNELDNIGHKVCNIINIRHRVSKEPLPMFFIDLEPQHNNKDIYNLEFRIRIEPPRIKNNIVQCTGFLTII